MADTPKRFSLDALVILIVSEGFGVPLAIAGGEALANEHWRPALLGFGLGVPLMALGVSFPFIKDRLGASVREWIIRTARASWPYAILLAFVYVLGPEIYQRATARYSTAPIAAEPPKSLPSDTAKIGQLQSALDAKSQELKKAKQGTTESQPSPEGKPQSDTKDAKQVAASQKPAPAKSKHIERLSPPSQPVCSDPTLSNCAQINYGSQTVNGYVTPPARVITQTNANAATALLKTAPNGSTVRFVYIGSTDDKEITAFFAQIVGLFADTGGRWQGAGRNIIGNAMISTNGALSHGEGVGCSVSTQVSRAGAIAKEALARAGFPCTHDAPVVRPQEQTGPDPDFYVSVGTRIVPPK